MNISGKWFLFGLIFLGVTMAAFLRVYVSSVSTTQKLPVTIPPSLLTEVPGEDVLYLGKVQFKLRCSKCHGMNAKGSSMGPNLTIYRGSREMLYRVIYDGKGDKMKGWGKKLRESDIKSLVFYVESLNKEKTR